MASERTIGRLSLYRRLLSDIINEGTDSIYSHELAAVSGATAAQVRRDIMNIGYSGNPNRGYDTRELIESIGRFLDDPAGQKAAIVGVGNLGRAILTFFAGRRPKLAIVASFDNDPLKFDRTINGCPCFSIGRFAEIVRDRGISVGIITVPSREAQNTADLMVEAGVKGILNFAPVPLKIPSGVFVEDIDMSMSLEKVAYFARNAR